MKTKLEKVTAALFTLGIRPFRCESSYPENDAPRNLQGRTHYVDQDTLKSFQARILDAGHSKDGLVYWLVESVQSRPNHGGYTRRAVVFDVFGTVINERPNFAATQGEWFKSTDKARESALEFVRTFDAVKHTSDTLKTNARRSIADARAVLATLARRSPVAA
jgi:hypothetical protein